MELMGHKGGVVFAYRSREGCHAAIEGIIWVVVITNVEIAMMGKANCSEDLLVEVFGTVVDDLYGRI
jgi:hypothetical protein